MIKIGDFNKLKAVRQTDNGVYLVDKEETAEVLLPNKYIPDDLYEDDIIEVFVFKDHEARLTATTQKPKITVGNFAYLLCKDVNEIGAFFDWGLDKDLLVPFRNQPDERLQEGKKYVIFLYEDGVSGRLVGTATYLRYLRHKEVALAEGQEVDLLIDGETEIGYSAIINSTYRGLIFKSENFKKVKIGQQCKGVVKLVRKDGNVDLSLHGTTLDKVSENAQKILNLLQENDGFLPYHDKTKAEVIQKELEMSKKVFKQAIGGLYSRRRIRIEKDGLYLVVRRKRIVPGSRNESANDFGEEE
jgi:predicted RNA-binding protein (virulence factor B family)